MPLEVTERERSEGGTGVKEQLEKLKGSFRYIEGCALLSKNGEISACDVRDVDELAFKLSILFDLENLEEILIEKTRGASYIKLFGDNIVYMEFTKKPNIPLLNMYLNKIIRGTAARQPRPRILTKPPETGKPLFKEPFDNLLGLVVGQYLLHERYAGEIAREFRDRLRSRLNQNPRVKRWGLRVVPNMDEQALEFVVIAIVRYSKGIMGTKDRNFEDSLKDELKKSSIATAEEIATKLRIPTRVKCFVDFI
jgi:hypothetical protein